MLPIENLSGNTDDEYFSEGMTDDVLTELYKIGNLRVISRTTMRQYKNTKKTIRDIGKELRAMLCSKEACVDSAIAPGLSFS